MDDLDIKITRQNTQPSKKRADRRIGITYLPTPHNLRKREPHQIISLNSVAIFIRIQLHPYASTGHLTRYPFRTLNNRIKFITMELARIWSRQLGINTDKTTRHINLIKNPASVLPKLDDNLYHPEHVLEYLQSGPGKEEFEGLTLQDLPPPEQPPPDFTPPTSPYPTVPRHGEQWDSTEDPLENFDIFDTSPLSWEEFLDAVQHKLRNLHFPGASENQRAITAAKNRAEWLQREKAITAGLEEGGLGEIGKYVEIQDEKRRGWRGHIWDPRAGAREGKRRRRHRPPIPPTL